MKARRTVLPAFVAILSLAACHDVSSPVEPDAPTHETATSSLSGFVRDAAGTPVTDGFIVCQGKSATVAPKGAAAGSFSLAGLQPVRSVVDVYQKGVQQPASFAVNLAPGANARDFVVERFRGEPASVSGIVRTTSGAPITGMKVWCQGRSSDVGADGSYALDGIVSGWWDLELAWGTYEGYGETVDLAPGANSHDFNVAY